MSKYFEPIPEIDNLRKVGPFLKSYLHHCKFRHVQRCHASVVIKLLSAVVTSHMIKLVVYSRAHQVITYIQRIES